MASLPCFKNWPVELNTFSAFNAKLTLTYWNHDWKDFFEVFREERKETEWSLKNEVERRLNEFKQSVDSTNDKASAVFLQLFILPSLLCFVHCDGPKEVSSTQNKVREKGGKSATQLVLQWCYTACVEVWKDGVQCTTSCYALPPALLSLSPFVHFDLILCLDFILIIFIFGLISISFLKADNYAWLYLKQADLIRLTPGYDLWITVISFRKIWRTVHSVGGRICGSEEAR